LRRAAWLHGLAQGERGGHGLGGVVLDRGGGVDGDAGQRLEKEASSIRFLAKITNLLANNVEAMFVKPAPGAILPASLCDISFEKVSNSNPTPFC